MDEIHPITWRLMVYGTAIRCVSTALIFLILFKAGIIQLDSNPEQLSDLFSTLTLVSIFLVCPFLGDSTFPAFWQRITPVKNKVTYFENEIVFAGSAFIGISIALIMYGITPTRAFSAVATTLFAASPILFAICFIKSKLNPMNQRNTDLIVQSIVDHQEDSPDFWRNSLAYTLTGLTTAITMYAALKIIPSFRTPIDKLALLTPSFLTLCISSILITPFLIWVGSRLFNQVSTSKGWHYALGGIVVMSVLNGLNYALMSLATSKYQSIDSIYNSVNILTDGIAHLMLISCYILGGLVFTKLYRADSISLQFK